MSERASQYGSRLHEIRRMMEEEALDLLVVAGRGMITHYGYVHWIAGYCPVLRPAAVIVAPGREPVLTVASASDQVMAQQRSPIGDVRLANMTSGLAAIIADAVGGNATPRIGVVGQEDIVSVDMMAHWTARLPAARFVNATAPMLLLKSVKTAQDIAGMARAAAIADEALDALVSALRDPGCTLAAAAGEAERVLRSREAVETLVYASTDAHFLHRPRAQTVPEGALVTAYVELSTDDGSWIELARLLSRGPLDEARTRLAAASLAAMRAAEQALRAERSASQAHADIAAVITRAGYTSGLWLGHGVGIDHDIPTVGADDGTVLQPGMTIALHPHLVDNTASAGASIGDTFVVSAERAERLSRWPIEVIELGGNR